MSSPASAPVKEDSRPRTKFIFIGICLLLLALVIPVSTFVPVLKEEVSYQFNRHDPVSSTELIPVDPEFSLIIPKINANAKVIKNVDPHNSRIYQPALTRGVAHAAGSALPGQSGNTFIFAHSAGNWYQANQFNAVFYLLNKLVAGDEIMVFYQSQKYTYTVSESLLVSGSDTSYLTNEDATDRLTLMTCWPPGTTLKRLIIIAQPQDVPAPPPFKDN